MSETYKKLLSDLDDVSSRKSALETLGDELREGMSYL